MIVLLHGFGANVHSWRDVVEPLSSYGNVLAYDRPAFGWTQRSVAELDFDSYSETGGYRILDSLIRHFSSDSDEVVLVGHSAGGGVATGYTLAHRSTVTSLDLVAPAIQLSGNNRSTVSWLARGEITDTQLASLQQPVLIITGDDDEVVATRSSIELAANIPNATVEVIPHSGQLPQEETSVDFFLAMIKHWQNLTN